MKLARKHWLVRIAYVDCLVFREPEKIPASTDLCTLVMLAIFKPPAFSFFLILAGVMCVFLSPLILGEWLAEKYGWNEPKPKGIIAQRLEDWREKKCTKIEIQ